MRNMCLAINGGVLGGQANEACRDGNFSTIAVSSPGNCNPSGSLDAYITFPATHIVSVRIKGGCRNYHYGGGGSSNVNFYVMVNGSWTQTGLTVTGGSASGGGTNGNPYTSSGDPETNGGQGWGNCSGVRVAGSGAFYDVDSGGVDAYEMEAYGAVGPFPVHFNE